MKLTEYLVQGKFINKSARLNIDISLDDGEERQAGDIITIVKDNQDGTFHAEDNEWACKVERKEFEYIN